MVASLTIDIVGLEKVRQKIDKAKHAIDDGKPYFEDALGVLQAAAEETFETEGYGTWPRLAQWTIHRKKNPEMLIEEGTLFYSLTHRGQRGSLTEIRKDRMRFGSRIPYYRFHASGTRRMPRRPPVMINRDTREELARLYNDYIRKATR